MSKTLENRGVPEGDIERTRDGALVFRGPVVPMLVGCDHPKYGHLSVLFAETRAELVQDLT